MGREAERRWNFTQPRGSSGPSPESELEGKKFSKEPACHAWEPGQDTEMQHCGKILLVVTWVGGYLNKDTTAGAKERGGGLSNPADRLTPEHELFRPDRMVQIPVSSTRGHSTQSTDGAGGRGLRESPTGEPGHCTPFLFSPFLFSASRCQKGYQFIVP